MSVEKKIKQTAQGKIKPALTRLKELSAEQRVKVGEILEAYTYVDAMPVVSKLVGFGCSVDVLFNFRSWQQTQQDLERGTDQVEQIENYLRRRHGDWSPGRIAETAIGFLMTKTLADGDVKGFATVMRAWLRGEKAQLDERKFKQSLRNKLDTGLDALQKHFEKNPEAAEHFCRAREVLQGREAQGGGGEHRTPNAERRTSNEGAGREGREILNPKSECLKKSEDRNPKGDSNGQGPENGQHRTPNAEHRTSNEGAGSGASRRGNEIRMAVFKRCGCLCEECNAGKELTPEEIASAGKWGRTDGKLVQQGECQCSCEGCEGDSNAECGIRSAENEILNHKSECLNKSEGRDETPNSKFQVPENSQHPTSNEEEHPSSGGQDRFGPGQRRVFLRACGCVCGKCHPVDGPYPVSEAEKDFAQARECGSLLLCKETGSVYVIPLECGCFCEGCDSNAEHSNAECGVRSAEAGCEILNSKS